jgi:signal peptidase S26 family
MLTLMSEAVSIAAPSRTLESASQLSSSRETRRYLLAEFFSAIVSGGGQLFLGQRRRGSILLIPFSALIFGFWPVRLLRFYPGLITLFAAWISLYYAVCSSPLAYVQHEGPQWPDGMNSIGPVAIPSGKSFVMTDSRDIGLDSRSSEFGLVEHGSVVGKPWYVFGSDRVGGNIP